MKTKFVLGIGAVVALVTTVLVGSSSAATTFTQTALSATVSGSTVNASVTIKASSATKVARAGICARDTSNGNRDFPFTSNPTIKTTGSTFTGTRTGYPNGTYTYWGCILTGTSTWHNLTPIKQFTIGPVQPTPTPTPTITPTVTPTPTNTVTPTPTITPTPTDTVTPTVTPTPTPNGVTPEQYGALGDGSHDDTSAVQQALDHGGEVTLTAGKVYVHTNLLYARTAGETIDGTGTLLAINEQFSAFEITAANVTVDGPTFKMGSTTQRWSGNAQHKIDVVSSGTVLKNIHVDGSAGAGIFIQGASYYLLQDVTVANTRADAIHNTGGSHDGQIIRPVVTNVGDDGVAVVSYDKDSGPSYNITVTSPNVNGTPARGISVVGGHDITETDATLSNTGAACVYVAVEPSYTTRSVANVSITGVHANNCNTNTSVDHGAVLLYNGRPSGYSISDVTLTDFTITNTASHASRQVGIINSGGGTVQRAMFRNFTINGGPSKAFYSQVTSYSTINWVQNGTPLPDHVGF